MRKIVVSILIFALLPNIATAKHLYKEKEYQKYWCGKKGGMLEYRLPDGTFVDCLTKELAVEFDFAPKWAECIGQSLHYGIKTKRTPTCVLIMERPIKDLRYLRRLRNVAYKKGVRTFTVKPENLIIDTQTIQNVIE